MNILLMKAKNSAMTEEMVKDNLAMLRCEHRQHGRQEEAYLLPDNYKAVLTFLHDTGNCKLVMPCMHI